MPRGDPTRITDIQRLEAFDRPDGDRLEQESDMISKRVPLEYQARASHRTVQEKGFAAWTGLPPASGEFVDVVAGLAAEQCGEIEARRAL